jgi:hypothetical protein
MYRNYRQDYAFYAKQAARQRRGVGAPEEVWRVVAAIGGRNRYYALDFLWTLRELADWFVGGPGFNRGRRDAGELRVGDTVDSWQVIGLEPGRRLTLLFGMKAPGAGILEFELAARGRGHARDRDGVLAPAWCLGPAVLVSAGAVPRPDLQSHDGRDRAPRGGGDAGDAVGEGATVPRRARYSGSPFFGLRARAAAFRGRRPRRTWRRRCSRSCRR